MINVSTNFDKHSADIADVARLFEIVAHDITLTHEARDDAQTWRDDVAVLSGDARYNGVYETAAYDGDDAIVRTRLRKRACKMAAYMALKALTGYHPPWGALTGIRPTRLVYEQTSGGASLESAVRQVETRFDVTRENAELLGRICRMQEGVYDDCGDGVDIYIGIPFCLTRCTYCSFAATDIKHGAKLMEPYVDAIIKEITAVSRDMRRLGRKIRCMYMGGGTPTALEAGQLERVLNAAREGFDCTGELTVEAGRPDSITPQKLRVIKAAGATRISINPQTMNDKTLRVIGRKHSAADIIDAFLLARDMGFDNINADIIAALPGEDEADFVHTLDELAKLRPQSLTVHTLAIKRSSALRMEEYEQIAPQLAQRMVMDARQSALSGGYEPYYLYRQKYMAGNLENVGYCLPGFQCVYNVDIMEETTPILAFGAGAISKWTYDRARRIERAPNLKNIEMYIAQVDEMIERKRKLYE